MKPLLLNAILCLCASVSLCASADDALGAEDLMPSLQLSEVEVSAQGSLLAGGRTAQTVQIISADQIARQPVHTVADVLKCVAGIDVRQRGAMGIQADINIDGGTHDQVTVLLNGVDITSPQTGHLSGDWPVNVDDILRIEILEGAGSRLSGSSSLMGIVNIITKSSNDHLLSLHAEGGSFLTFGASASASKTFGSVENRASALWKRSDGGTPNSDFYRYQAHYQGRWTSPVVDLDWQFGGSAVDFGANTFYSAAYPNQHEHDYRLLASVRAAVKTRVRIEPMVYWNRLGDHYQLIRDTHTGENFHRCDVYGASLSFSTQWVAGRTNAGVGVRHESLLSTALGAPLDPSQWVKVPGEDGIMFDKKVSRTAVNLFAEHNVRLGKWDVSAGVTVAMNTGQDRTFRAYPGIDISYRPTSAWRITASWNRGFRMPTFTDLYYKSVVLEGNKDIKSEKMQSWKITAAFTHRIAGASVRAFFHQGTDLIDWVMFTPDDIFHSTSFNLNNFGFSIDANLHFQSILGDRQPLQTLTVGYTQIHQDRKDKTEIYKSNYALEYLRHKFVASLTHRIIPNLECTWSVRWALRNGAYIDSTGGASTLRDYEPYAVLDLRVQYQIKRFAFSATANNLTNNHYHDFGSIPQPGFWLMLGVTATI